ncbi:hypothetical protein Ahy_A08g040648 [Arachis hypogaea]|uniref:Uncharacterized protein n=1 Tax=Arachis hypogaea TaxID=3818 RepID=A0A445BZX5_ARAHY|nr:hypothetical protein Ahy_A08g040648 [Arachis hypogaea]
MQLKFIWNAEHNLMISKIYDYQTAKRFQQRISDVRKGRDHLWSWIRLSIKKKLETYFTLDEGFKYRHLTNVANRAFPKSSKHTGGSTTFIKTKSILSKSLDREATLAETIKYTHTLKANKEKFADELGSFSTSGLRSSAFAASSASATSPTDPQEVVDLKEEV